MRSANYFYMAEPIKCRFLLVVDESSGMHGMYCFALNHHILLTRDCLNILKILLLLYVDQATGSSEIFICCPDHLFWKMFVFITNLLSPDFLTILGVSHNLPRKKANQERQLKFISSPSVR